MIIVGAPIPVPGQMCREFGHTYVTVYGRSWKRLFRKKERTVCLICDSEMSDAFYEFYLPVENECK